MNTIQDIIEQSNLPTRYLRQLELLVRRFCLWRCKTFGHSFSQIDIIIFDIKTNAINADMNAAIKCQRCMKEFIHKNA